MKRHIALFLLMLSFLVNNLFASSKQATVKIIFQEPYAGELRKEVNGAFLEFLNDFVNGPFGHYAQEFLNRGFDAERMDFPFRPLNWLSYIYGNCNDYKLVSLEKGGYNQNGEYYIRMTDTCGNQITGIYQKIYTSNADSNIFYIYAKGQTETDNFTVSIRDTLLQNVISSVTFDNLSNEWVKYQAIFPRLDSLNQVCVLISFEGKGILDLDEASFMPSNNRFGLRKEIYDYYKLWLPGVFRYPGGWYAETQFSKLEYSIGPIDQRKSPNGYQRMDFGTDEFIAFCKDIQSEPHFVVSTLNGTPEEAATWLEYCNGSPDSKFGKIRANNGNIEPFNVKYWEIGNEQFDDPVHTANTFLKYYDAMKSVDSSIITIINGDIWQKFDYFNKMMSIVKDKCDIYGFHETQFGFSIDNPTDEDIFLSLIAGAHNNDYNYSTIQSWIEKFGLTPKLKIACTEWWNGYQFPEVWDDSNPRTFSLESGLWTATWQMSFMRHPSYFVLGNRTTGLSVLKYAENSHGKRVFWLTPSYWAMQLLHRHSGNKVFPFELHSEKFSTKTFEGMWTLYDVPWLDLTVTASPDSIFITVINRNPHDSIETIFDFGVSIDQSIGRYYQLNSNSYLDSNSRNMPDLIKPIESDWNVSPKFTFPPHSLTILAIPILKSDTNPNIDSNMIRCYPNPAKYRINLSKESGFKVNSRYSIVNSQGMTVLTGIIESEAVSIMIKLTGLSSGLYFVRLFDDNSVFVYPIIKISD